MIRNEPSAHFVEEWENCLIASLELCGNNNTLHAYFNISPESPDGRFVLLFSSEQEDVGIGDLLLLERGTGCSTVLLRDIKVEDAHRQANQQWVAGGDYIVCQALDDDDIRIVRLDPVTGQAETLCGGRGLFCSGQAGDEVPLYGEPRAPGRHRDLELLNVRTGKIRTALTLEQVQSDFPAEIARLFTSHSPVSIAVPVMSPDGSRVIFKLACPDNGRTRSGSERLGMFVYDLKTQRPLFFHQSWDHPSWLPDSCRIAQKKYLIDLKTGSRTVIPGYPPAWNSHPAISETLLTIDLVGDADEGRNGCWSIWVGDLAGHWLRLHTLPPNPTGWTTSWRKAHPHPVFSPDGSRIYFNAPNAGKMSVFRAEKCVRM